MKLQLTSSAFQEGQPIPVRYTGDGQDARRHSSGSDPPKARSVLP